MKVLRFHKSVVKDIDSLDVFTKSKLVELFGLLTKGMNLGMPVSRPMPVIANGAHELRLKSREGQYRVFYYTKHAEAILIFHAFKKKTQTTPPYELEVARKRLMELL
ncbi:MAG: type II toxin-antitoxin system RelE/ParE family toxin [Pseudomonadota bacterium]